MLKQKFIVLKKIPYGESDWVVTLLSEEGSRLTGFAPKARVSQKRFGGALDLFNYLEVQYAEGRQGAMPRLQSVELLQGMEGVRNHLTKFAAACFFSEFIIEFLQEHQRMVGLFPAFHHFLTSLNTPDELPPHMIPLLENHFLELFGFQPTLNTCLSCRLELAAGENYFFDGIRGGIICSGCATPVPGEKEMQAQHGVTSKSYPLSFSAIQKMLGEFGKDPKQWAQTQWNPEEVREVRKALEFFIQYTAGKRLKSLDFLSRIFD